MARYGEELRIVGGLGIKPRGGQYGRELLTVGMDATVVGQMLYVTGRGKLHVADISDPGEPHIVGELTGLGNSRQIAVNSGVAYVTAREDGLFIVDVTKPHEPELLCHYDSIEFATGVAVSGDVAFLACRNYGVELVNVSDPVHPVHISTVRTGEAQSVAARDGYLYTGVWGTCELVTVDVRDARKPVIAARAALDGYGDGVDVRGAYCFVATGHHSREFRYPGGSGITGKDTAQRRGPLSPGYGCGHGLEIFDIANPAEPVFVSRIKTPPFYRLGMDFWSVTVSSDYAFVADTHNGIFVVDVSDPRRPRFVAHRQLDYLRRRGCHDPVGGVALGPGTIYVPGIYSDVHVMAAPGLAATSEPEPDAPPIIAPHRLKPSAGYRIYRPEGQVHAVAVAGDSAITAAGSAGIHVVQIHPEIQKLTEQPTEGFAMDVKVLGDHVYVAEGRGGLSIWRYGPDASLTLVGRYRTRRATMRQVVIPPPGRVALLHVGANYLHVVDVADPLHPRCVLKDTRLGLLVGDQIADGFLGNRYACVFWHVSGLHWYDLQERSQPVYTGDNYACRIGAQNGIAFLEHEALVTYQGKYFLLDREETRPPDELPQFGVEGHDLTGKPCVFTDRLYVSNRPQGRVSVVDISDLTAPKLVDSLELEGNPGRIIVHADMALIPAGYQGLLVREAW